MRQHNIRIIGGQWRSRLIEVADAPHLRPTPNRIRETLFNWLQLEMAGSVCLDLFAGSGALGLEAASRGAKKVVQLELNPQVFATLQRNINQLNAMQVDAFMMDAFDYLQAGMEDNKNNAFDLAFIDAPFGLHFIEKTCQLLEQHHWLKDSAMVYLESEKELSIYQLPANWQSLKKKKAGDVYYGLFAKIC